MTSRKKYIHLLFVVGVFSHSLPTMSAEFNYGSIPLPTAQEVSGITTMLSEIISENPVVMPVLAGITAATALFCGRNKIAAFTKSQCSACERFVAAKHAEVAEAIKQECLSNLKNFEQASLTNRLLLSTLGSSLSLLQYIKNSQWYMGAAAVVFALGHVAGHAYIGAGAGTGVLIKGWHKQDFKEMHSRFNQINQKVEEARKENARLHEEAQEKLVTIGSNVKKLSEELADTGTAIQTQMKDLQITVSADITTVGQNLTALDGKLKDVPQQILKMASELQAAQKSLEGIKGSNSQIMEQNNQIVGQTKALSQQIETATRKFASTTEEFSALGVSLTERVKKLTEDTQKKLETIENCAGKQMGEIEELKADVKKNFEGLFERVQESTLLMQSFKNIQESHDFKLTELTSLLNESKGLTNSTLNVVNELMKSQEKSASQFNKMAGELVDTNRANSQAFELINSNVTKLNQAHSELQKKMEKIEFVVETNELSRKRDQRQIIDQMDKEHDVIEKKFAEFDQISKNNYENIRKQLEEEQKLLNLLFKQNAERQEENRLLRKELKNLKKELDVQRDIALETNKYVKKTHDIAWRATGNNACSLPYAVQERLNGSTHFGVPVDDVSFGKNQLEFNIPRRLMPINLIPNPKKK